MCKNWFTEIIVYVIILMYSLQPRIRTEFCFFRVSDKQSLTVTKSQGKKINLSRLYDAIKFFAKAQLAFLFK